MISLETRVTNASVAAFASDHPELGESMHRLLTSADALKRGLQRYASNTRSHTGDLRTPDDIVRMWRDYVLCLLDVDERGRSLNFESPMLDISRVWLQRESAGHKPSPWLKRAMANAALKTGQSRTTNSGPE